MLACLCRAVSDKKVLKVIQEGATTVEEVSQVCGAGSDCGTCKQLLQRMLDTAHACATKGSGGCRAAQAAVDAAA
jgi:bacterioferritin-associated ferredoxin